MEDCVNEEHKDSNQNGFIEENGTEVHDEVGEISIDTENEGVINRYITENETEKNLDASEEVIDEFPYGASPAMMEDCVDDTWMIRKNSI